MEITLESILVCAVPSPGHVNRDTLSDWAVCSVVGQSSKQIGIEHFGATTLRRTCATNERSNDNGLRAWLGDDPM